MKCKLIIVCGPTATGKSDLAVLLAKKFNGEIVSADSRAIYRGLDIGTAKPVGKWLTFRENLSTSPPTPPQAWGGRPEAGRGRNGDLKKHFSCQEVRFHLVDFLSPKKTFSAADFAETASKKIEGINDRGCLPIVCGGSGFWIEALLDRSRLPNVPPNPKLRKKLETKTSAKLFDYLKKLDSARARSIDQNNRRRLIRAIEIASTRQGEPLLRQGFPLYPKSAVLFLGLTLTNAELKKRIRKRFLRWLRQGLVAETKKLTRQVSPKRLSEIGLQYAVIAEYLAGKFSRKDMIERSVNSIYHYAKRQKTWFKRNKKIHWVKNYRQAENQIRKFLNQKSI